MPETGPGARVLTLTPLGPHSTARCLVIASGERRGNTESLHSHFDTITKHGEKEEALTICSLSRASVHLEALSSVSKCCRDVHYVATVTLHTQKKMMGDFKSMQ